MNSLSFTTCGNPPIIVVRNEQCIQVLYEDGVTQIITHDMRITIAVGIGCGRLKKNEKPELSNGMTV